MASIRKREIVRDGQRVVKYDVTVTRKGAPRLYQTFSTRAAAEKWARKAETDIEGGVWVDTSPAQSMTVAKALDLYVDEAAKHLKAGHTLPSLARAIKDRLGNLPLSALSTTDLVQYRDARLADRARRGNGGKDGNLVELDRTVSAATVRHELGALNRALAHVESEHGIVFPRGRPQLDFQRSNVLALNPGRDRVLTDDERGRVIAACSADAAMSDEPYAGLKTARSPLLLPAVEFMLETAARPGELVVLLRKDVNFDEGLVALKNKKTKRSKSPERRLLPMSPRLREILVALCRDLKPDDLVFRGTTRSALYQGFRRALKRAGVEDYSQRDLRHDGATRLADVLQGDVLMLADMTGHQDIRMLRRYVSARRKQIADRLAKAPPAARGSSVGSGGGS